MKLELLLVVLSYILLSSATELFLNFTKPPAPKYGPNLGRHQKSEIRQQKIDDIDETNIWEHSGYFEGDIMTYDNSMRNGHLNQTVRWPNATVPFYIDPNDFSEEQITVILKAMQEYHNRTCIRFRPYENTDKSWVLIKGNYSGCWSSVGRIPDGQILNLNVPRCVKHGVVLHELLHALGFYHQQSSSDRDDYVKINWENILEKHEFNFNKYNESVVTSFGVKYDYRSIMHYSAKAFSKNGKPTIEPLEEGIKLGQRKELSEKDVIKLNRMYENITTPHTSERDKIKYFISELIKAIEEKISKVINKYY